MKASDLFIKALEAEGVEYIFGIPGEENLDFLNSLRDSSIQLILTRHEQAAGFMAATYGRLTGRAGVCLSTLGPGATNLVTAAAYAQLGAMPMLMITGQKPIKARKQGQFQIVNIVDMMRPLTKYTFQIASGSNIPYRVREAFRLAEEERPGAVHLELPEDIAQEMTTAEIITRSVYRRPLAEGKAVKMAAAMIHRAKRPLLLIGAGANRKHSSRMLRKFVDKTGIPFFSTQMGKGVIDERHPLFLGSAALSANDFLHRAISHADLIINVGHDVVEKPPFFMEQGGFQVIHVNYLTAAVDPVYYPQLGVVGDIANSVYQLSELVIPQTHWNFSYFQDIKAATEEHLLEGIGDDRFPIYPQRLVHDIREAMPDDGIIALDNGIYKIWFARNYKAHRTQHGPPRQRPGEHGSRVALGDGREDGPPGEKDPGHLRGRRFHDEFPGTGDGGAPEAEPGGPHPPRQRLRHGQVEADPYGFCRFRPRRRQSRFRPLCRKLWRARPPAVRGSRAHPACCTSVLPLRGCTSSRRPSIIPTTTAS